MGTILCYSSHLGSLVRLEGLVCLVDCLVELVCLLGFLLACRRALALVRECRLQVDTYYTS